MFFFRGNPQVSNLRRLNGFTHLWIALFVLSVMFALLPRWCPQDSRPVW
jgi:hypothetical protein